MAPDVPAGPRREAGLAARFRRALVHPAVRLDGALVASRPAAVLVVGGDGAAASLVAALAGLGFDAVADDGVEVLGDGTIVARGEAVDRAHMVVLDTRPDPTRSSVARRCRPGVGALVLAAEVARAGRNPWPGFPAVAALAARAVVATGVGPEDAAVAHRLIAAADPAGATGTRGRRTVAAPAGASPSTVPPVLASARLVDGLVLAEVGDDLLVGVPATGEGHALNRPAAVTLDLCDGPIDADLALGTMARVGLPPDPAIVLLGLAELVEAGIAEVDGGTAPWPSRRALIRRHHLGADRVDDLPRVDTVILERSTSGGGSARADRQAFG